MFAVKVSNNGDELQYCKDDLKKERISEELTVLNNSLRVVTEKYFCLTLLYCWHSRSPEVTSSPCVVVGNETMCFRFSSNVTTRRCSELGGVIININSSSSSSVAATAPASICYHNDCNDYIVNAACFQHRLVI